MTKWNPSWLASVAIAVSAVYELTACSSSSNASQTASIDAGGAGAQDAGAPCVAPTAGELPSDVFCTGLYVDRDATRHDPTAQAYKPGVVLWSDGADKQRYLYLPPGSRIDTSNIDSWKFPLGTKAWKEFRFDGKLVETRLFWRGDSGWLSGTYIWDAAQKAAPLNTSRQPVILESGYEIPTAKDCGKCHHGAADNLLGIEAVALALPAAEGVTLTSLVMAGSLSDPPVSTQIALPEDSTGKAGEALGYLHANCGMPCHSARGLGHETELILRLRADQFWPTPTPVEALDSYLATIRQAPTTASVAQAFPGANRITPGAHDQSLVWLLSHTRGKYQMPPLVSHKVDEVGTQKLLDWIDALPH